MDGLSLKNESANEKDSSLHSIIITHNNVHFKKPGGYMDSTIHLYFSGVFAMLAKIVQMYTLPFWSKMAVSLKSSNIERNLNLTIKGVPRR
jgi:hypothetical protein